MKVIRKQTLFDLKQAAIVWLVHRLDLEICRSCPTKFFTEFPV